MLYALVNKQTNVIENVIVLDEGAVWAPPESVLVVRIKNGFGIGDTWDGSQFIRASEPMTEADAVQPMSSGTQTL